MKIFWSNILHIPQAEIDEEKVGILVDCLLASRLLLFRFYQIKNPNITTREWRNVQINGIESKIASQVFLTLLNSHSLRDNIFKLNYSNFIISMDKCNVLYDHFRDVFSDSKGNRNCRPLFSPGNQLLLTI